MGGLFKGPGRETRVVCSPELLESGVYIYIPRGSSLLKRIFSIGREKKGKLVIRKDENFTGFLFGILIMESICNLYCDTFDALTFGFYQRQFPYWLKGVSLSRTLKKSIFYILIMDEKVLVLCEK